MAEAPPPDEQVKAFDRLGEKVLVPSSKVNELVAMGGRVATRQELDADELERAYAQRSAAEKITSVASLAGPLPFAVRAGVKLAQGRGAEIAPTLSPDAQAYVQGVGVGATGGLAPLAMKELVRAAGGDAAASAYGKEALAAREASPVAYGLGQAAGFVGGAAAGAEGAAARALPGAGISSAGNVAERAAARALASVAERGAMGRAAATAGQFAARGAVETGLYAGAQHVSDELLGDHELAADKVALAVGGGVMLGTIGGGVLGGAGSLARSAVVGAGRSAGGAIARVMGAESAVAKRAAEAGAEAAELARKGAEAVGTTTEREAASLRDVIARVGSKSAQEDVAFDLAFRSTGARKAFVAEANARVKGGTSAVGEALLRHGVHDADAGVVDSLMAGTPQAMQPKLAAKVDEIGQRLGQIYEASGARVPAKDVARAFDDVIGPLQRLAGYEDVVASLERYRGSLTSKLGLGAEVPAGFRVGIDVDAGVAGRVGRLPKPVAIGERVATIDADAGLGAGTGRLPSPIEIPAASRREAPLATALGEGVERTGRAPNVRGGPVSLADRTTALRPDVEQAAAPTGTRAVNVQPQTRIVDDVSVQQLLEQRMALDRRIYEESKALDPNQRVASLREVRGNLQRVIEDHLDAASNKVPGELRAEYKQLAGDYQKLKLALRATEDTINRGSANQSLGLTDKIVGAAVGSTIGSVVGGPVGGFAAAQASRFIRARGEAAASVLLYRMAQMGTITRAVARVEKAMGGAAKGLVVPPKTAAKAATSAEPRASVQVRAEAIRRAVVEAQASPETVARRASDIVDGSRATAPKFSGALEQRLVSAVAFLASRVPAGLPADPLDPHGQPRMTDAEAHRLVTAAEYVREPMRVLEDAERGHLTPDGVDVLRTFAPGAFAELQQRTLEQMAATMTRGVKIPYAQREALGVLLDVPATPSQRPEHMRMLQAVLASAPSQQGGGARGPKTPSRPSTYSTPKSPLDRLEGR